MSPSNPATSLCIDGPCLSASAGGWPQLARHSGGAMPEGAPCSWEIGRTKHLLFSPAYPTLDLPRPFAILHRS
eukprot:superscaffoldBa00001196_g9443